MRTEPLWFSRMAARTDIDARELVAMGNLDPYGQHQALWKMFNVKKEERTKRVEFLFRTEQINGLPVFYVLSHRQPDDQTGHWRIESKRYSPVIENADQLAFKLRVNPTVSKASDRSKNGRRHDVVMDKKQAMKWKEMSSEDRPALAQIAYEAGSKWLCSREDRLGCHFNRQSLRVDGYRTWRQRQSNGIAVSTLDFEGGLTVTDSNRFLDALLQGIGPAKAFGCGLLLVRRLV